MKIEMTDKPVVGEAVTGNAKLFARIAELEARNEVLQAAVWDSEEVIRDLEGINKRLEARLASQERALEEANALLKVLVEDLHMARFIEGLGRRIQLSVEGRRTGTELRGHQQGKSVRRRLRSKAQAKTSGRQ